MSVSNSTSEALAASASWVGDWETTDGYTAVTVDVKTDQSGTVYIQQSTSGSEAALGTPPLIKTVSVSASVNTSEDIRLSYPFFRLIYINGSSAQGSLGISSRFGSFSPLTNLIEKVAAAFTDSNGRIEVVSEGVRGNTLQVARTTVTTAATKIDFPEVGTTFEIYVVAGYPKLYLGNQSSITAGGAGTVELPPLMKIPATVLEGNDNEFYGITDASSIDVFVVGVALE